MNILFYIAIVASVFCLTHSKWGTIGFVHNTRPGHDEDGIAFKTFGIQPDALQDHSYT